MKPDEYPEQLRALTDKQLTTLLKKVRHEYRQAVLGNLVALEHASLRRSQQIEAEIKRRQGRRLTDEKVRGVQTFKKETGKS